MNPKPSLSRIDLTSPRKKGPPPPRGGRGGGGGGGGRGGGGGGKKQNNGIFGVPVSGVNGCPKEGEKGNWRCRTCMNVNFGHRSVCNRCKLPK